MRITLKKQKGFTLTPALFILSLIMIAGTIYLLYINSSGKAVRKIETSNIAKYAAEVGILQLKSQLAKLNVLDSSEKVVNKWYNAKAFDYTSTNKKYIFQSSATTESSRTETNTARVSGYIDLKDNSGKITSRYRITLEDGSLLSSSKTATGSLTAGIDKYGNNIWSNSSDKNFYKDQASYRYGVRVDGFAVNNSGNNDKSSQSIYAVIDVPNTSSIDLLTNWSAGTPSGFLLSTNGHEDLTEPIADRYLNLVSGQIITGPIHSNNKIDFTWEGNFDIFNPDRPNSINEKYTVNIYHTAANGSDNSPTLVSSVVREVGQSPNQITIYGTNFSLNPAYMKISVNGSAPFSPTSIQESKLADPPLYTTYNTPTGIGTKMVLTLPALSTSYKIDISNLERSQSLSYTIGEADISNDVPVPVLPNNPTIPPLEIYGFMQVSQKGALSDEIYKENVDYVFVNNSNPAPNPPDFYKLFPYISWYLPAPGIEPNAGEHYQVTYLTSKNIPHNKIKVFNKITYSGIVPPTLYYIHSHKAPGSKYFPWTKDHSHEKVFGIEGVRLETAEHPKDYFVNSIGYSDWGYYHRHQISPALLSFASTPTNTMYNYDSFFKWKSDSYKPTKVDPKISPILAPNNVNYYSQRAYADQMLKIMLNKGLSKDNNNYFRSPDEIPEDRANGYYKLSGGMIDFGATYFGNDLKYSAGPKAALADDNPDKLVLPKGSLMDATKEIYVNEDKSSIDYMKVADTVLNISYKRYTYRQIPKNGSMLSNDGSSVSDGGVIFVKDGVVRIGGANYKGVVSNTGYTKGNTFGSNTIIDGRLTISSYSETKPSVYVNNTITSTTDNPGDIVITGNIIYKNRISPWEKDVVKKDYNYNGFRQYSSLITGIPSESDFITDNDGKIKPSMTGEKVNSLALIASNDIKIPVSHYRHPSDMENHYTTTAEEGSSTSGCPCKDTLVIQSQLIAGHKITQTKVEDEIVSKNDRIILYGSFYSYEPPNLAYFGRSNPNNREEDGLGRIYLYDKTLNEMQLAGAPMFPKDTSYTSETSPVVGTSLPRIVPGTWKVVSDGAQ